jgi:hypothetical protein
MADEPGERPKNYERNLGVVEAFLAVRDQCPSGAVRRVALDAIEAVKHGGPGTLREQTYFVLTAIQGWRGERATQVHRSLQAFLDSSTKEKG